MSNRNEPGFSSRTPTAVRPDSIGISRDQRTSTRPRGSTAQRSAWTRSVATFTLAALALAVAGCHVDQKAEVAKYRQQLDATSPSATGWSDDRPLTLANAMALANANNEQLERGGEDYVQAIIAKNRAVAAFLPTLTFQPSYSVIEAPRGSLAASATTPGGGSSVNPGQGGGGLAGTVTSGASGYRHLAGDNNVLHRFEAPVVGSINLFRAGADLANLRAAEFNIEAEHQLLLDLQSSTLLNVAQAYFAVLRAERSVAVLGNSLQLQEARLADVETQFKNGLATRLTVAQSRAEADGTRASLVQAQGDVINARTTLALIVGVDHVNAPLVDDFAAPRSLVPVTDFERDALRLRPDVAAASRLLLVAQESVTANLGQYYPSVSLNVSGFLYREYFTDASKWSAILSANLPIFSAGLIQADVRAAWSRLRQAALDESYTRRLALAQVRQSYQNFLTADRRLVELNDQVAASRESLFQARNAFAANLAVNLDVLTAQDQLLTSELQQTNAAFDRTVFYLDLLRATGTLTGNGITQATSQPTTGPSVPAESGATTQPIESQRGVPPAESGATPP